MLNNVYNMMQQHNSKFLTKGIFKIEDSLQGRKRMTFIEVVKIYRSVDCSYYQILLSCCLSKMIVNIGMRFLFYLNLKF